MTDHLLNAFKQRLDTLALKPSDGGRFEVMVDDELVYSKLQTGRFPDQAEIEDAVRQRL